MTLEDARKTLQAEVIVGTDLSKIRVEMCCGADLMSDVLAFAKSGSLLLSSRSGGDLFRARQEAPAGNGPAGSRQRSSPAGHRAAHV